MSTNVAVHPAYLESGIAEKDFSQSAARDVKARQVSRDVRVVGGAETSRQQPSPMRAEDAVRVQVGQVASVVATSDARPVQKGEKKVELSEEEARDIAKSLEKYLNEVHGTKVKFNVSLAHDEANAFSFQVVEKKTGRVVRQFPPEDVMGVAQGVGVSVGQGVLVDDSV